MGKEVETLAEFAATLQWQDIPSQIRAHARKVFLDTFGVILAGSERPEVAALRARLARRAGSGATLYARGFSKQDPRSAALMNGIAGRAIELCEGLRLASGQVALQVLPAVLAVAETEGRSGRELMTSFIAGYEVAGRMCSGFTPRALAHQNGQAALLGAAAAAARLHGFDAAGISLAMRIATTQLLTPSYTNTVAGATTLNVAGGMSGFAGALAPELVLAGFAAQADAIEEALGKMVGERFDPAALIDGLGTRWLITQNYFRLYACCNPIHPALDCLREVLEVLRPSPDDIDRIEAWTYRFAAVMRDREPSNYFAARYSLPHAAAVMVMKGAVGHGDMDDAALTDARIAALRARVHVSEDPAMSALAPKLRPARCTVTLKDGRSMTHAVESHRGDFNRPFSEDELRGKFRELAGTVLDAQAVAAAEQAIEHCERWANVGELIAVLRGTPGTQG
jgi:2-methylcitrate dehydratase PrpD